MIARKHPIRLRAVLLVLLVLAVLLALAVPLVRRLALQQALAVLRAAKRFTQATIQTRQRQI